MSRVLFVSATLIAAAAAVCTVEQMTTITACYKNLTTAYGITDFPPFGPDYFQGYDRARSDMIAKDGIAAQPTIAKYGAALINCLAPVADCIEDTTYEQAPLLANPNAVNGPDGHRFNLDRLTIAYVSFPPGYDYQMRHFYCIDHLKKDTTNPLNIKYKQCDTDMNTALTGAPTDELKCTEYNKNMDCYRDAFSQYCNSDEAGEFYCQLVSEEYRMWAPTCTFIDCKKH